MNEPLRPVEIKKYENDHEASIDGKTTRVTKGFFHQWADKHQRVGERELGGPCAIVEAKNGQVVVVDLCSSVSMRFTDVGLIGKAGRHVKCETCGGPKSALDKDYWKGNDCKDCGGTGWVEKVQPNLFKPKPKQEIRKGQKECEHCGDFVFLRVYDRHFKECTEKKMVEARKKGLTRICADCNEEYIKDDHKVAFPSRCPGFSSRCPKCNP